MGRIMENLKKIKQWALGVSVVTMLGFGWACTDEDAPDNLAPGFSSFSAENVMRTSAKLSASLTGSVNLVKEYGFQYSTSSEFPTDQTKAVKVGDGQPSGNFLADLTGLERNKTYYYRVYASTGATTVYSQYGVFNTPSSSQPALADTKVVEIGENYAKVSFRLVDIGDEHLIECGVGYMKSSNTDNAYTPVVAKFADSVYVAEIFDLEANTNYNFRPYAKNGAEADGSAGVIEGYGNVVQEKTDEQLAPKVKTEDETSSGISSITVSGLIDIDSPVGTDGTIFDCGFVWCSSSEGQKPRLELNHSSVSMQVPEELDEHFVAEITGLMSNTTYYVCAYARNEVDGELKVGYGSAVSVSTGTLMTPNINIDSWGTTASSIFMTATITNYDKGALTEKGYIYDRSSEISLEEAKKNGTFVQTVSGGNVFTDTIPNLAMNTSYMVRAYAVYEAEGAEPAIGYSGRYDITTSDYQAPSVGVELDNSKVTRNSAELVGKLYGEGNGTIIERGFLLIEREIANNPTFKVKGVTHIVSDESFVTVVKNLKKDTDYSYNSYVISKLEEKVDTVYAYTGDWASNFWTKGVVAPTFNNVVLDDATYGSFKATCGISEVGDGKILEKGFWYKCSNNDFGAEKDSVIVESDAIDEFSTVVSGKLTFDTWCYVRAYVKKDIDGEEIIFTSNEANVYIPSPSSLSYDYFNVDNSSYKKLLATLVITSYGDAEVIDKGFCCRAVGGDDYEHPTIDLNDALVACTEAGDTISATLENLKASQEYYVRAYFKVKYPNGVENVEYSWTSGTWTSSPNMPGLNYSPDIPWEEITSKSFKVSARIDSKGNGTITNRGFVLSEYDKNSEPTIEACDQKWDDVDETFEKTITGLKSSTTYAIRAFVVAKWDEDVDTVYNNVNTVTTHEVALPSFKSISFSNHGLSKLTVTSAIEDLGDGTLKEKGFCWDRSTSEFTLETETTKKMAVTTDSLKLTLTELDYNTRYYVRAYAKVEIDGVEHIAYSGTYNDRTSSYNYPSMDNAEINTDLVTRSSAPLSCVLNSAGNGVIIEKGFVLSLCETGNYEPTLDNCNLSFVAADDFTATATGLEWNKEYAVRAYVTSKWEETGQVETEYSGWRECFWTKDITYPSFNSLQVDSIGYSSVLASSGLTSLGDGEFVEKGFIWVNAESNYWLEPTIDNYTGMKKVVSDSNDSYSLKVDSLMPGKRFGVRAYAKVKIDDKEAMGYSSTTYFYTNSLSVEYTFNSEATTCDAWVKFNDEASNVKAVYVYLTTNSEETDLNNYTKYTLEQDETTLEFSKTIDNLVQNSRYSVKIYYEYKGNLLYYGDTSFSTKSIPQAGDNVSPGKKEDE